MNSTTPRGVVVETLESRQFMAAQPFAAHVNFQPSRATVPVGYVPDSGATYANRGNGYTYGWSSSNANASNRNSSLSPDQRYDTLNRIQSSTLTWSLAVPNGQYRITVVAGDPTKYDGYYSIDVEGIGLLRGDPTSTNRWVTGTGIVDVKDGQLTLRNGVGASNNKICFIDVQSVSDFVVYDATTFANKPNLSAAGMTPMYVSGTEFYSGVWPNFDSTKPDETATRAAARKAAALDQPVVINIEHWNVDIRTTSLAIVQSNIAKLIQVVDWMRDEEPQLQLGFYSLAPIRDYWTPVQYENALVNPDHQWYAGNLSKFTAAMTAWKNANAALDTLAQHVDFISPSLYTFYEDRTGWLRYAEANIEQARRYGKPVYPFIWMNYHDSTAELARKPLPEDFWRLQLDTVKELADSVVIWGGYGAQWDANAEWWSATSSFLNAEQVRAGTAVYRGTDNTTKGNWAGKYGSDAYDLFNGGKSIPRDIFFNADNALPYLSTTTTTDSRALAAPGQKRVLASNYTPTAMTYHFYLDPNATQQLSLYMVDWNNQGISQRIEVIDPETGTVLDSRTVSSFYGGRYLKYDVSGRIDIRITRLSGPTAVLNGVFFD